ncbi:MAG TPA: hypothetical protein VMF90_08620 [Rhizobiaceae bacterium]|nr:hypothetical protein [Rhizobiaceae bacterium]
MLDLAAHRKDRTVAFAAALVLLLQAFITSWSLAAPLHDPQLDAFGNPLCITSGDRGVHSPADTPGNTLDCCALSCSLSSTVLAAPTFDSAPVQHDAAGRLIAFPTREPAPPVRAEHASGSPRSPPLKA